MLPSGDDRVAAVQRKPDPLLAAFPLDGRCDGAKCCCLNLDLELFDRRHEEVATVRVPAKNRREETDEGRSADRRAFVKPGAVPGDAHPRMAADVRIPALDRRKTPLVDEVLEFSKT